MEREPLLQEAGRRSYASIPNLLLSHPRIPKEEREQVPDLQPTSLSSKFASLTEYEISTFHFLVCVYLLYIN